MLNALTVRYLCLALLVALALWGCRKDSDAKKIAPSSGVSSVVDRPTLLDTIPENLVPGNYTPSPAPTPATPEAAIYNTYFAPNGRGVAYIVVIDGRSYYVVHNGKPGQLYAGVNELVFSPDGGRVAYSARKGDKSLIVLDGAEGQLFDDVLLPQFSPDNRHFAYLAKSGARWHIVVDGKVNTGTTDNYNALKFSGDSSRIIYTHDPLDSSKKGSSLIVSRLDFSKEQILDSDMISYFLNGDGSTIASVAKTASGKNRVALFSLSTSSPVWFGPEYDKVLNLSFAPHGTDLFYTAERQGTQYGVYGEKEESLQKGYSAEYFAVNQATKSAAILMEEGNQFFLYKMFSKIGRQGKSYDDAAEVSVSSDGAATAFIGCREGLCFVVANGSDGPAFDRVVSPKFSPDGKYLVYRVRKAGKRFVVVADASGKVLRQHPAYEMVFDVAFTSDGKSVAYGVKDGQQLLWKVEKIE